jgi:serine/threonine protein kinase
MDERMKKALVVDDEEHIRTSVRDALHGEGYSVALAADATEAMELIPREVYDIVIMDIRMPGLDGMQALRQIREYCPHTGIIMISGHASMDNTVDSMKLGAFDFLRKPFAMERLKETVKNCAGRTQTGATDKSETGNKSLGKYEFVREIAAGGTSRVWEAIIRSTGQRVAVKVLHQHLTPETNFIQRFQREAEIAASLHHPNIVAVYEYGVHATHHFIAMEFVDGCSLESVIARQQKLPLSIVTMIGLAVAAALEYSHGRNVIHRDVKPGNILLSKEGSVKVTDFGFSRIVNSLSARLTMANRVVGTPLFMAPEMIAGKQATYASDVFSLGIVLYILMCGRPPFSASTLPGVMQKIMECNYVKPRKVNRKISKSMERIIVSCLQKNMDLRYQTMDAVMNDMKHFVDESALDVNANVLAEFVRKAVVP